MSALERAINVTSIVPTPSPTNPSNIDDPFGLTDGLRAKCIIVIAIGVLSLFCTTPAVAFFVKYRAEVGHPIVEGLIYSFLLAIPATINVIIAGSLRLADTETFTSYCNVSGFLTQQFEIPQLMMEAVFFGAMGYTLLGGRVTSLGMRRIFVASLVIGTIGAFVPMATLPKKPSTNSVFGAATPWCWFPTYDEFVDGKWRASPMLNTYKLIFGYIWTFVAYLLGGGTTVIIIKRSMQEGVTVSSVLKFRIAYYVLYSFIWTFCLIPRYFGDMLAPQTTLNLEYALPIAIPGVPMLNALLFFYLDGRRVWAKLHPLEHHASRGAYDDMERIGTLVKEQRAEERRVATARHFAEDSLNVEPAPLLGADRSSAVASSDTAKLTRTFFAKYDEENTQWVLRLDDTASERVFSPTKPDGESQRGLVFPAGHVNEVPAASTAGTLSLLMPQEQQQQRATDPDMQALEAALQTLLGGKAVIENLPTVPKPPIGVALSCVAGYCDALGFIGLGLFTAHVTGNIVLAGVHLASEDLDVPDIIEKLAAVCVFCITIAFSHTMSFFVTRHHRRFLLVFEGTCFLASFACARNWGPFDTPDAQLSLGGYLTSMLLVAGMAAQNSYQRSYLVGLPLTAFMTGNTNQVVHDVVEIVRKKYRKEAPDTLTANYTRLRNSAMNVGAFFLGSALATVSLRYLKTWAGLPPVLGIALILVIFFEETKPK